MMASNKKKKMADFGFTYHRNIIKSSLLVICDITRLIITNLIQW